MPTIEILTLGLGVFTAWVGLYSRSKVQQVTIDLTDKFDREIKEEKKNYAIKLQKLEDKIDRNSEMMRIEYATKQDLQKMEDHITKRVDGLEKNLGNIVKEAIKEVL